MFWKNFHGWGEDETFIINQIGYIKTRKGWCPRTGKGQRFMGKEAVNGNVSG